MRWLSACRANTAKCVQAVVDLSYVIKMLWSTGRNLYQSRKAQRGSAAVAKRRLGG